MKLKLAFAAVALLGLSGCAAFNAITGATVSPQAASVIVNSFDASETVATAYLQLPQCATGGPVTCRKPAAVATIVPAVRSGRVARDQIMSLLNANNGGAIPVASYNTLQAAITSLQAVYSTYSIH